MTWYIYYIWYLYTLKIPCSFVYRKHCLYIYILRTYILSTYIYVYIYIYILHTQKNTVPAPGPCRGWVQPCSLREASGQRRSFSAGGTVARWILPWWHHRQPHGRRQAASNLREIWITRAFLSWTMRKMAPWVFKRDTKSFWSCPFCPCCHQLEL